MNNCKLISQYCIHFELEQKLEAGNTWKAEQYIYYSDEDCSAKKELYSKYIAHLLAMAGLT